jgi:hypothetical protein
MRLDVRPLASKSGHVSQVLLASDINFGAVTRQIPTRHLRFSRRKPVGKEGALWGDH